MKRQRRTPLGEEFRAAPGLTVVPKELQYGLWLLQERRAWLLKNQNR